MRSEQDFRWGSLLAMFAFLTGFWIAIWLLDFLYNNRLLLGTVDALKAIEERSENGNRICNQSQHVDWKSYRAR
jgi:hypothetical protein